MPTARKPPAKKTVWVSANGEKHRLDATTGVTVCGLEFSEPYPTCNRTDPMCLVCTHGMR